jgi:hypothetical protein
MNISTQSNHNESLDLTLTDSDFNSINDNSGESNDGDIKNSEVKMIHTICETEECTKIGVDLKDICDIEGDEVFDRVKKFVEKNNQHDLKHNIQKLFTSLPKSETINSIESYAEFENLLILKTFKRLKLIEKNCIDYKMDYELYDKYQNMYVKSSDNGDLVHSINMSYHVDDTKNDKLIIQTLLTPYKMHQELLTYELLFYKPNHKIPFTVNNFEEIAKKICTDISRFNPIIQIFIEDHSWTVNTKDTLNFSVPKNRVVLSNTIKTSNESNSLLTSHLDILMNYISRVYKVVSAKYVIIEDNKFYFSWILITIGYKTIF